MTISYNWLSEYLSVKIDPERLSKILTAIGLEVESMTAFESIKGGLKGVVIGKVLTAEPHPNADKLRITTVEIGAEAPLQIVCGAPNVAAGQIVAVATIGATIYPKGMDNGLTMKLAKIRGVESHGMICAEDELGLGNSHDGIMVLPADWKIGEPAAHYFNPYNDIIFEIGLTPNRMDAMSHLGVARDVTAYLIHHDKANIKVKSPLQTNVKADTATPPITVTIDTPACKRYTGVTIDGVTIGPSPEWLQHKLSAIGLRPINNIVDITNFILHETGQPLHAFDATAIEGNKVIVRQAQANEAFITLDEKQRQLHAEDIVIANATSPMCIGGVFGGSLSGVTSATKQVFLESAWFDPTSIRKTSFRHQLRTDAATRFEKGVDISQTLAVLKRAAALIVEVAGGKLTGEWVDVYPAPKEKVQVALKHHYLKKLTGKNYHPDAVKKILTALGFELVKEGMDELWVAVPHSKPDISLPADLVEEILRIDGLDNVDIPTNIAIAPAVADQRGEQLKEKLANLLVGSGFREILNNSITNSAYFSETTLQHTVKMINNLSAELDVMRPSMLEPGLGALAFNLNRQQQNLLFFEIGKTYTTKAVGDYREQQHLAIWLTGQVSQDTWQGPGQKASLFHAKGITEMLWQAMGLPQWTMNHETTDERLANTVSYQVKQQTIAVVGMVSPSLLKLFDIKQPVIYIDIHWDAALALAKKQQITFTEIAKFPAVQRDLAIVVGRSLPWGAVQQTIDSAKVGKLRRVQLFDIFESEKLGADKKSLAINFVFQDEDKTLTDKEIDAMMQKIRTKLEQEVQAEIRK